MQRREFAKTIGGIGVTTALGGTALVSMTGGATAESGLKLPDPDVTTSDDGRIKWVAVEATGRLEWDGFDEPAKHARLKVQIELWQDGETVYTGEIHDTGIFALDDSYGGDDEAVSLNGDYDEGRAGHIASRTDWGVAQRNQEHHYRDGYGLPQTPAPTNRFTSHDDGEQRSTRVVLRNEYSLYDADQEELTGRSDYPDRPVSEGEFVVTVENEEATTEFGAEDGNNETEADTSVGV